MKTFKEIMEEDLNVFFNPEEFGEYLTVDTLQMVGLLSSNKNKNPKSKEKSFYEPNHNKDEMVLSLKEEDFNKLKMKKRGEMVQVNSDVYKIIEIYTKHKVVKLNLEIYK